MFDPTPGGWQSEFCRKTDTGWRMIDEEQKKISKRISAKDALDAEYFWTDPLPCDPKSLPQYESSHEYQTKKRRQQRQHEEAAKRQKMHHSQQHGRLPPIQHTGQSHHWSGPNHPMNNAPPPVPGGPGHHHYGKPRGPPGGPNRYPGGNQSGGYNNANCSGQVGGYNNGPYAPQGRGPPYAGSGMPANGPRGPSGGYGVGPPNYSQSGQYGSSGTGRGPNPAGGNRNQQYGWQQ